VFDDFGWLGNDRQTFVEIQWMAQRGHSIMELPTGQGLVLKH
jgi:O-methyltransferase